MKARRGTTDPKLRKTGEGSVRDTDNEANKVLKCKEANYTAHLAQFEMASHSFYTYCPEGSWIESPML
jgi:hypothetical protein